MKFLTGLMFLGFGFSISLKAQSGDDFFKTGDYRHTINYTDHKATFYTLSALEQIKDAQTDKNYYWYSNNHISTTQGGYSGKLLHGLYSDFYLSKGLKEQGYFKKGLKTGDWKSWTEAGMLISITAYREGARNGKFNKYSTTRALVEAGNYKKDKLNGKLETYTSPDSLQLSFYKDGVLLPQKDKRKNGFVNRLLLKIKKNKSQDKKDNPTK